MRYSEDQLEALRLKVQNRISNKRFAHTLSVERCAMRLGAVLLPDRLSELRAAAILHDVSKEIDVEEQMGMLIEREFELTDEDKKTSGIIHSFSAPIIIKKDFNEFATDDILSATLNHSVGAQDMSVFDKIIFISDYTEDTRTYESCVRVRNLLFENYENLSLEEADLRLNKACIAAIDETEKALVRMNKHVNSRMLKTKKSLMSQIIQN